MLRSKYILCTQLLHISYAGRLVRCSSLCPFHAAGVALSTSDGSTESLFGGYFHDSSCSTPYALAADSYNLQTLAAAIKVRICTTQPYRRAVTLRTAAVTPSAVNAILCVQAAGLVDVLDTTTSEITVFVPTDDAFAALADTLHMTLEDLLAESNLLSVVSS